MYLPFIHRIQLLCNTHSDSDANHENNNCNDSDNGNINGNGDSDGNGDGGCDYNANSNVILTDVGITLVVTETAAEAAVILMTNVIDCQEQARLRVANKNPVEDNRYNYFSYVVIHIFFSRTFVTCIECMLDTTEDFPFIL